MELSYNTSIVGASCLVFDRVSFAASERMGYQAVSIVRMLLIATLVVMNVFGHLNFLAHISTSSLETLGLVELTKVETAKTNQTFSISPTKPHYNKKNVSNIFWLHIQKTGTSFFNTLFYHFCPRARHSGRELPMSDRKIIETFPPDQWCDDNVSFYNLPGVGGHHPYRKRKETFWTFTMFRDPAERLRSAFAYNRHGIRAKNKSSITFDEYIRTPQLANCQIKMVLGHSCHKFVDPSRLSVSKALERVDSPYFFFGLTDRWDESLCLFHNTFGGKTESYERVNNRKTNNRVVSRVKRSLLEPLPDLDTEFVRALQGIFELRLRDANCTFTGLER